MKETNATNCTYTIDLVGKGKKYKLTTVIEEVDEQIVAS